LAKTTPTVLFPTPGIPINTMFGFRSMGVTISQ
jgi:hypothetical protein